MKRAAMVLGLAACTGQSGEAPFIFCPTVEYIDVTAADDTLGYSADDVVAGLETPTEVTWRSANDKTWVGTTLPLALSALTVGSTVQIADYTDEPVSCELRGQRMLEFEVDLRIDIGAGQGVAEGPILVRALGQEPSMVTAMGGWGPEVALSGELGDAVDAWWADTQARNAEWTGGFELESVHANLFGPWEALEVSIEAQHRSDDYVSVSSLFRGFTAPEAEPPAKR